MCKKSTEECEIFEKCSGGGGCWSSKSTRACHHIHTLRGQCQVTCHERVMNGTWKSPEVNMLPVIYCIEITSLRYRGSTGVTMTKPPDPKVLVSDSRLVRAASLRKSLFSLISTYPSVYISNPMPQLPLYLP